MHCATMWPFSASIRVQHPVRTPVAWRPVGIAHSPGNFTYSAHHAFFAGFLPTPVAPGKHPRLFATRFSGSETTTDATAVFDAPDIVSGFRGISYHTVCIGGVGFFNRRTPLSCVFPAMFAESHWEECLGVADPRSTENQVALACRLLKALQPGQRVFLFINVSAIHQPNCIFLDGACEDEPKSQAAALAYVDRALSAGLGSHFVCEGTHCASCALITAPPTVRMVTGGIGFRTRLSGRCPRRVRPRRLRVCPAMMPNTAMPPQTADCGCVPPARNLANDPFVAYCYS